MFDLWTKWNQSISVIMTHFEYTMNELELAGNGKGLTEYSTACLP